MGLVADSGGLYALYDRHDKHHRAVKDAIAKETGPIILPSAILAELDYLLCTRIGATAEARFLEGIAKGVFSIEPFTAEDAVRCRDLLLKYRNLNMGLAHAAVIATAERLGILRVLTVDERDFRAVRTKRGDMLVLVPGRKGDR